MCMNTSELHGDQLLDSIVRRQWQPKRSIRVHRLHRRRLSKEKAKRVGELKREMEMKNLKLYMENQCIIQENEKLRMKALLLHQENTALLSLYSKNYPSLTPSKTNINTKIDR